MGDTIITDINNDILGGEDGGYTLDMSTMLDDQIQQDLFDEIISLASPIVEIHSFEILTITINGIVLETFDEVFEVLGQHTLATNINIENNASIEIQCAIEIIKNEKEYFTIQFGIANFDATFALFAAVKDDLTLYALTKIENYECFKSYIHTI